MYILLHEFIWVKACHYCRIIGMYLIVALPILLIVPFYLIKRDEWDTESFEKAYCDVKMY